MHWPKIYYDIHNKKQPKKLITQMPLYLGQTPRLGLCPLLPAHSAVAPHVLHLPPGGCFPALHHCWRYWCYWYCRQPAISCGRLWCCACRWGTSSWASAKDPHTSCETRACGEREKDNLKHLMQGDFFPLVERREKFGNHSICNTMWSIHPILVLLWKWREVGWGGRVKKND